MKPPCEIRDRDLLMLVHRQLGPWAALRTRLHVRACPACRERLRRLEGLSSALASGLRNPRLGALPLRPALRPGWAGFGLLALLLTILGGLVSADLARANAAPATSAASGSAPALCHVPASVACPLKAGETAAAPNLRGLRRD